MQAEGLLFIFSGPSGVGKNTIMHGVINADPTLRQLPTATTRARRGNEKEGREHEFLSEAEFRQRIINKQLIEWQIIHDKGVYGVPRNTVQRLIEDGRYAVADVDVLGAMALKQEFGDHVVLIFVEPPSLDTLKERLSEREDVKSEVELLTRLRRVDFEMGFKAHYDYVIVNHDGKLDESIAAARRIIEKERQAFRGSTLDTLGWKTDQLQFVAIALVHQNGQLLQYNGELPHQAVPSNQMPFEALHQYLQSELGVEFSPLREHATKRAVDIGFEAPQMVKATPKGQHIIRKHIYILEASAPLNRLPAGWTWQNIDSVPLDDTLRQLLLDTIGDLQRQ